MMAMQQNVKSGTLNVASRISMAASIEHATIVNGLRMRNAVEDHKGSKKGHGEQRESHKATRLKNRFVRLHEMSPSSAHHAARVTKWQA